MSTGKLPAGTEVERLRGERDRLAAARVRAGAEIERLERNRDEFQQLADQRFHKVRNLEIEVKRLTAEVKQVRSEAEQTRTDAFHWAEAQQAEIARLDAAYKDRGKFIEGLSKLQVVESQRARAAEEERDRLREQALTDGEARVMLASVTYPSMSDPDSRVLFESACEKLRQVSARQQADAS